MSETRCDSGRESLGALLSCTIFPPLSTSFSKGFKDVAWRARPSDESNCCNGQARSMHRQLRN